VIGGRVIAIVTLGAVRASRSPRTSSLGDGCLFVQAERREQRARGSPNSHVHARDVDAIARGLTGVDGVSPTAAAM